jgi:hypothetical protein
MALENTAPPAEVLAALKSQIHLFTPNDDDAARIGGANGIPVFTIGLSQAEGGMLREVATLSSWRFLTPEADQSLIAEVSVAKGDAPPKLASVSENRKMLAAMQIASKYMNDSSDQKKGYTLRVLRIPGILLEALWLHSANDDIVIPTYSKSPELEQGHEYRADEFLKTIQPVIARFRRFDELKYDQPGLV